VLVLGIAQVPALIVTLPAIGYIWSTGDYSTGAATGYTVLLFVVGMLDNVLKPLMLGRGVDVPMPVILLGALGGMATSGIIGLFVGATLLALGYKIFMSWVAANPYTRGERSDTAATGQWPADVVPAASTRWTAARQRCSHRWCCPPARAGPDFTRPTVPWLEGWKGGALQDRGGHAVASSAGQYDDAWWRQFNDPVLDQLVAEAQRANPGVRTAGLRILEARAQLGIGRQRAVPAAAARRQARSCARAASSRAATARVLWAASRRVRPGLGAGLLGQVQARHRVGQCRVLRRHRTIRRPPGPHGGAGGQLLATIRTTELRLRFAQENAAIQQRSLEITDACSAAARNPSSTSSRPVRST
jgi:hypothetical protein